MIDYWCNAFTPDRAPLWRAVVEAEGLAIRTRDGSDDDFVEPSGMLARMDHLGVDTLVLPVCDITLDAPLTDFAHYAARPDEITSLAASHPTRFVGMYSVDPSQLDTDLAAATEALDAAWCVALHSHTHSWDRTFDHPDYTAYYELCADRDVPFVMQAGASGGHFDHRSGHPDAIAGPATAFPAVTFVLSHTGAPWVEETIRAATDHTNVVVGTATHPPKRWPRVLIDFISGPGRTKTLFGTGFPLTGHSRSLAQLAELGLPAPVVQSLLDGNARRIFGRIPGG